MKIISLAVVLLATNWARATDIPPNKSSLPDTESKSTKTSFPAAASGAYFGLKLPGEKPELFAPGIINIPGRSVGRIAFSPDATECAFTVFEGIYSNNRILFTRYENSAWTPQIPGPTVDGREMLEPLFSRDNSRLYFAVKSTGETPNTDLWEAQRTPQRLEQAPAAARSVQLDPTRILPRADRRWHDVFRVWARGRTWRARSLPDGHKARPTDTGGKPRHTGELRIRGRRSSRLA